MDHQDGAMGLLHHRCMGHIFMDHTIIMGQDTMDLDIIIITTVVDAIFSK